MLCPVCKAPELVVSPPIVTLTVSRQQQFTSNRPVTWANPVTPPRLYTVPSRSPRTVPIVARTRTQPPRIAAANVTVVPSGFQGCSENHMGAAPAESRCWAEWEGW